MVRGLERSGSVTKPQRSLTQVVTDAEEIVDLAEAPRFTALGSCLGGLTPRDQRPPHRSGAHSANAPNVRWPR